MTSYHLYTLYDKNYINVPNGSPFVDMQFDTYLLFSDYKLKSRIDVFSYLPLTLIVRFTTGILYNFYIADISYLQMGKFTLNTNDKVVGQSVRPVLLHRLNS